ncbi:MAG: adenylyl-sulfate kinase [Bacteroidales bacterium]|nr:adenylyl-sulfate kinase [Bacteroidales bacterium]
MLSFKGFSCKFVIVIWNMAETFTYKAFGLIIKSDFEIPELLVFKGLPDVQIKSGKAPVQLKEITKYGVKYQAAKNEFLLEVDHIAKYYVNDGAQIVVEPYKGAVDKEVRLFLLGSAFGALFLQRGLLPVHGSTVKFGNSATIFTGLSGVGKSSIAAYFVSKGYHVLADDISVVNHKLEVVPGFPNMKIWNDVLQKLDINEKSLAEIRPNMKKFQLPVNDNYFNEALALKNIVIIITKNSPGFEYEELSGIKKFNAIKSNTYRYRFVQALEQQLDHFQLLNKLLPEIKVYKVTRPQSPLSLSEFGNFLINTMKLNV